MGDKTRRESSDASEPLQPGEDAKSVEHTPVGANEVDALLARSGETAGTSWMINFTSLGADQGKRVMPRTPQSALFVNNLTVSPDAAPGESPVAPKVFRGVTLTPAGPAFVGQYAHPKARAGLVSSSVAYGKKPRFDFTLHATSRSDAASARHQHAALVREVTSSLDDFVDEAEAQAVLDRVIQLRFPSGGVEATMKRSDGPLHYVNTTDLHYAAVNQPKTFRLRIDAPTTAAATSVSFSTTVNGEQNSGHETLTGSTDGLDVTHESTIEHERRTAVERAIDSGLNSLAEKVQSTASGLETVTVHSSGSDTTDGSKTRLSGGVKGNFNLVPDLPGLRWIADKLGVDAKVEVNLSPDYTGEYSLKVSGGQSLNMKNAMTITTDAKTQLASHIRNARTDMESSGLSTAIRTAIKTHHEDTKSDRDSGASKQSKGTTSASTSASVQLVANTVQPILTED